MKFEYIVSAFFLGWALTRPGLFKGDRGLVTANLFMGFFFFLAGVFFMMAVQS